MQVAWNNVFIMFCRKARSTVCRAQSARLTINYWPPAGQSDLVTCHMIVLHLTKSSRFGFYLPHQVAPLFVGGLACQRLPSACQLLPTHVVGSRKSLGGTTRTCSLAMGRLNYRSSHVILGHISSMNIWHILRQFSQSRLADSVVWGR